MLPKNTNEPNDIPAMLNHAASLLYLDALE